MGLDLGVKCFAILDLDLEMFLDLETILCHTCPTVKQISEDLMHGIECVERLGLNSLMAEASARC